jgi:hypothetical protein
MQPPSEADVASVIGALETRRDLKLAQVAALQIIQSLLSSHLSSCEWFIAVSKNTRTMEDAASDYLVACISEHQLDAEALDNQAKYIKMSVKAQRSNLIVPTINPRTRIPIS